MSQDCPLTEVLGAVPPDAVLALPVATRARLAEQVATARRAQRELGDQAVASALRGVPLPVRGVVRRALGG